jgi:hypothetical protein
MAKSHILKILYWIVVISVLVWTVLSYNIESNDLLKREILLRHGIVMMIISMPSGLLLMFVADIPFSLLSIKIEGLKEIFFISLCCGIAGYIQWFMLLPWVVGKFVKK